MRRQKRFSWLRSDFYQDCRHGCWQQGPALGVYVIRNGRSPTHPSCPSSVRSRSCPPSRRPSASGTSSWASPVAASSTVGIHLCNPRLWSALYQASSLAGASSVQRLNGFVIGIAWARVFESLDWKLECVGVWICEVDRVSNWTPGQFGVDPV